MTFSHRFDPTMLREYDIRGVMGPDEFHDGYADSPGQGIDNNAYINVMTAWTLSRARDAHFLEVWPAGGHAPPQLDGTAGPTPLHGGERHPGLPVQPYGRDFRHRPAQPLGLGGQLDADLEPAS